MEHLTSEELKGEGKGIEVFPNGALLTWTAAVSAAAAPAALQAHTAATDKQQYRLPGGPSWYLVLSSLQSPVTWQCL